MSNEHKIRALKQKLDDVNRKISEAERNLRKYKSESDEKCRQIEQNYKKIESLHMNQKSMDEERLKKEKEVKQSKLNEIRSLNAALNAIGPYLVDASSAQDMAEYSQSRRRDIQSRDHSLTESEIARIERDIQSSNREIARQNAIGQRLEREQILLDDEADREEDTVKRYNLEKKQIEDEIKVLENQASSAPSTKSDSASTSNSNTMGGGRN